MEFNGLSYCCLQGWKKMTCPDISVAFLLFIFAKRNTSAFFFCFFFVVVMGSFPHLSFTAPVLFICNKCFKTQNNLLNSAILIKSKNVPRRRLTFNNNYIFNRVWQIKKQEVTNLNFIIQEKNWIFNFFGFRFFCIQEIL